MQSQYYHELDHMRNTSQRPSPSKSLDRSTSHLSSSRTHTRTQSTTTHNHQQVYTSPKAKATYFDRNDGGWLVSSPVQLSSSVSHSPPLEHLQHSVTESSSTEECSKDVLGTISNDDILKLTQLTNKLPVVSTKHNHIQKGHATPTSHHQHLLEDEILQQHDDSNDMNDSRRIDTGVTNLLNQDFMRSTPISDTECSALLTIPSTISTDTNDTHFSWHNNISISTSTANKFAKQPPLLRKTLSEQTTATAAAAAEKMRYYHPLTISTTAPYTDFDLTPSSSQNSHQSKRRSWYKSLMKKRDKKGKTKYTDSPMTNNDALAVDDLADSTDEVLKNTRHTIQHESTMVESDVEYHTLRSRTHPMVADLAANDSTPPPLSSDSSTKKRHGNLSMHHRFRFPTRRKRRSSSFGVRDQPSTVKVTTGKEQQPPERRRLYGRRHSFDNIREYGLPLRGTSSPALTTTTKDKSTLNNIYSNTRNVFSIELSSAPSIVTTTSSLSAPSPPYIPSSSNIPSQIHSNTTTNGNNSPRLDAFSPGTPKMDLDNDDDEDDDDYDDDDDDDGYDTDESALDDNSQHIPVIEITSALSQQQQQHHDTPPSQKILYFDYVSLPWDNMNGEPQGVKALVKKMIDNGYGRMTETPIMIDHMNDESDDDDDDDEDLESKRDNVIEEESDSDSMDHEGTTLPTIESSKVIGGDAYYIWLDNKRLSNAKTGTRLLAEIHVDEKSDTGFFKLTQLAEEAILIKGRLLQLYVSFLAPGKTEDDMISNFQEISILDKNISNRLVSLDPFIDDAKVFLNERTQRYRAFVPMDDNINTVQDQQQQPRKNHDSRKNSDSSSEICVRPTSTSSSSLSSLSSFSSSMAPIVQRSSATKVAVTPDPQPQQQRQPPLSSSHSNGSSTFIQSLWNCVPYHGYNAYDYRQEQLRDAILDLQRGMEEFKRSLQDTETMVHGVQIDMNDTKAKMDTYLKDVPETHYSELKRLEVSIESILANRAKSRGMELLYWLLTALLTGSAFLLWAVIYALKLGQTVISFPGKMIKAFNEHMEERNKVVKQAGRRIVAKGAERSPPSPFVSSFDSSPLPLHHATPYDADDDFSAAITDDIPIGSKLRRSSSRRVSIPK